MACWFEKDYDKVSICRRPRFFIGSPVGGALTLNFQVFKNIETRSETKVLCVLEQ